MQTYEHALSILRTLNQHGYEAYLVGGCVRDLQLHKKPLDYDITTNARPDEVEALFPHTIPTGKDFGTITVMIDHHGYETTTYRLETEYTDGRRPKAIQYADDLIEDLSRRDFTINALVMNAEGHVADYFSGKADLQNRIIRTIGDPHQRFSEDYLRMLRAIRFSCILDFEIEAETYLAIQKYHSKIQYISAERVRDELNKIMMAVKPSKGFILLKETGMLQYILPELHRCIGFRFQSPAHYQDVFDHTMNVMDRTRPELELRIAALLHDISKPDNLQKHPDGYDHFPGHQKHSAEISRHVLYRLKYSKKFIYQVIKLIEHHQHRQLDLHPVNIKMLIRDLEIRHFPSLVKLMEADIASSNPPHDYTITEELWRIFDEVVEHNHPVFLSDLAVDGNDVARFGYHRKEIGQMLQKLLDHVLVHPKDNTRPTLLALLKNKL